MRLVVSIRLEEASTADGTTGVDAPEHMVLNHHLEFMLAGDNINGPAIQEMENRFFETAKAVRRTIDGAKEPSWK